MGLVEAADGVAERGGVEGGRLGDVLDVDDGVGERRAHGAFGGHVTRLQLRFVTYGLIDRRRLCAEQCSVSLGAHELPFVRAGAAAGVGRPGRWRACTQ